jgi:hypothetical protein
MTDLPDRLRTVLTERFTELGNPFSEMRRHEQGPDGWPASHPVGPHQVAEVLRELLATDQPTLRDQLAAAVDDVFARWEAGLGDQRPQDAIRDAVLAVLSTLADRADDGIDWKAKYELEHARHVEVVSSLVTDRAAVLREAADAVRRKAVHDGEDFCNGIDFAASFLNCMADETQQPEEALCGKTVGVGVPDHPYRPCARPAGHPEAYCRDATGQHYFLAAADQPDAEPEETQR